MYSTEGIYVTGCFRILEELTQPFVDSKQFLSDVHMERFFIYSLCWSFGALLELEDRSKFSEKMMTLTSTGPPLQDDTAYEYFVDANGEWAHWRTKVEPYVYPTDHEPKFAEGAKPNTHT